MPEPQALTAVLWDFGGVILSSPFEAFNRYESEQGLPLDFIRSVNATNPHHNAWARLERNEVSPLEFDDAFAEQRAGTIRALVPVFAVMSAFIFYGGVAMATRRHYRMAQLGCVLAVLHVAYGCCLPGALAGLWGLLMLSSAEGREHFGR